MHLALPRRAPGGNAGKGCVGVHPAQVGARLRLDAPQQGGNRGGLVLAVGCGSGQGGGQLGNLPAPAGARRRHRRCCLQWCGINGGIVDACGGGCLFVPSGKLNEIKKPKKKFFALDGANW